MKTPIAESELIINPDGSIFHLHLLPEDIADTIILVGDQDRVDVVSSFFDKIEVKKQNREFRTHTGTYKGKRLSVVSTGIGTDNVDIVVNELDAIANIDLKTRLPKDEHKTLNFIRIGTSGALQEFLNVDEPVASRVSLGFDNLLNFYERRRDKSLFNWDLEQAFVDKVKWNELLHRPYSNNCSQKLFETIAYDMPAGITISASGFYGPQGRELRLQTADRELNEKIRQFDYNGLKITNYEMECSAIYGLSKLLGHEALTVCLIIANRYKKQFTKDYKPVMVNLIQKILDRIVNLG